MTFLADVQILISDESNRIRLTVRFIFVLEMRLTVRFIFAALLQCQP